MITATTSATQSTQSATSAASQASVLTSDFETFLLMLTTQAQNQDPLEPLDSSEYASQLAQFSMVEQQVQANDLLGELVLALGGTNLNALSNWVGQDVRAPSAFAFSDSPVSLYAQPDSAADEAALVIRDASGTEVDRVSVPVTGTQFQWAGVDGSGAPLPAGTYSAYIESYSQGDILSTQMAATYDRVVEVQISDGETLLTLSGGGIVSAEDVVAVRAGS